MRRKSKGVDNTSLLKDPNSSSNLINHPNHKGHRINNNRSKFLSHTMFLLALISQGEFPVCLRGAQVTHNL